MPSTLVKNMVAARAECSKRSLYAHYPSKEKLFIGVIELVRGMFLREIKMPTDYASDPLEAMVILCARYVEILTFERPIQMCRMSMAGTGRFPKGGQHFFDAMFSDVQARLSAHIASAFGLSKESAEEAAEFVLGQVLHLKLMRALLGIDELAPKFGEDGLSGEFDLGR